MTQSEHRQSQDDSQENEMNKYRNKPTMVGNVRFDSKREAARWSDLLLLQRAGEIVALTRQHPYVLTVNTHQIGRYIADFVYIDKPSNKLVVEDVKGVRTREYQIKKKLMRAIHGIEILET